MKAEDIENYLAQLGDELQGRGIEQPLHILMIGGAFMLLLAHSSRSTDDVDFFWLDGNDQTLEQAISLWHESVQAVATNNDLEIDWLNYMTHLLMYGQVTLPKGRLWKKFGPLHIHVPAKEYVLALKVIAGRDKDLEDMRVLLKQTKIRTREQVQVLLDRYIPPLTQKVNADGIARSFKHLFEEQEAK
jgi:hypothetical protein